MADKSCTAVVINDHVLLSDMLHMVLKDQQMDVVASFTTVEAGEKFVIAHQPTLVIVEMMMPTPSPLDKVAGEFPPPIVLLDCVCSLRAVERISRQAPATKILILSGERHPHNFAMGLKFGAHGIASKVDSLDDFLKVLQRVLAGEKRVLSARMESLVAEYLKAPIPALTDLEKRILELVQCGMENPEIGRHLGYAAKTIRNTLNTINQKLGTKNRIQAAALAEELGLIGWPSG